MWMVRLSHFFLPPPIFHWKVSIVKYNICDKNYLEKLRLHHSLLHDTEVLEE